jgi:hypothetical protein
MMMIMFSRLCPGPDVIDREGNPHVDPEYDPYHSMHTTRVRAVYHSGRVVNPTPASLFRNINIH